MDWPYEIAERDHEIQNPTSAEKIRLLGEYLRLDRESRVLDVACGARHADFRRDYLGGRRSLLGWAILVGRKS